VNWINPGSGNWDSAANWSTGKVPGTGDVAVINTTGNATITIQSSDTIQVQALSTASTDTLSITGGSLSVTTGASTLSGVLTMSGGTLIANGSGASLQANGATTIAKASLYAEGGASLDLPQLRAYSGTTGLTTTLEATGTGSTLSLPLLTALTVDTTSYGSATQLEALAGGALNVPDLTTINTGAVTLESDGANSVLDAAGLTGFTAASNHYENSALQATHGGTLDEALTGLASVNLTFDGTGTLAASQIGSYTSGAMAISGGEVTLSALTAFTGSSITVSGGAVVSLPQLTNYTGHNQNTTTLEATGTGSSLSLPELTSLTVDTTQYGSATQIEALAGGSVSIPLLASINTGVINLASEGTGSTLNLSALTGFTAAANHYGNSTLQVTTGGTLEAAITAFTGVNLTLDGTGTIATSQIASYTSGALALSGGMLTMAALTNLNGASITVSGGATLNLPGITSYTGQTQETTTLEATGTGSTLSLPALSTLTVDTILYGSASQLEALAGGTLNVPELTSINTGTVDLESDGAGSTLNIAGLSTFTAAPNHYSNSALQVTHSGAVDAALTSLAGVNLTLDSTGSLVTTQIASYTTGTLTLSSGTLTLAALTDLDGSSVTVSGGATLNLPGVTSYTGHIQNATTLQATGVGSTLSLPALTNLSVDTTLYGSATQFEALAGATVNLPLLASINTGTVDLESDGSGSVLNVADITGFTAAANHYMNSALQATHSGTLDEALTALTGVNLTLDGTGTLATAQITSYTNGTLTLSGGSLALTGVTVMDGSNVTVSGGASLNLPNVASYTGHSNLATTFEATGTGSTLSLPLLTALTVDTTQYGSVTQLEALAGATVNIPLLVTINTGTVALESDGTGSVLNLADLTSFTAAPNHFSNSALQVTHSGTLDEALTSLSSVNLTLDGTGTLATSQITSYTTGSLTLSGHTLTLGGLTDIDGSSFTVSNGASLSIPNVQSYNGHIQNTTLFEATGVGSTLSLPELASLAVDTTLFGSATEFKALAGGTVNLPVLATIDTGTVQLVSDAAGSVLNIPELTAFICAPNHYVNSSLQVTHTGTFDAALTGMAGVYLTLDGTGTFTTSGIATYTGGNFTLSGGALTLAALTDLDGSSVTVSSGAILNLPSVASYTGLIQNTTTLEATGTNSTLSLPELTTLTVDTTLYGSATKLEALAGGTVNVPLLVTINTGEVNLESDGTGSVLNLAALTGFTNAPNHYGNSSLQVTHSGTLDAAISALVAVNLTLDGTGTFAASDLTSYTNGTLTLSGGSLTLAGLTNLNGASVTVSSGATLSLPGVSSYTGLIRNTTTLEATGTGSSLTLAGLTSLTVDTTQYGSATQLEALAGGTLNAPLLTSIDTGTVDLESDGTGSMLNLPALTVFTAMPNDYANSALQATHSGTLNEDVASLTSVNATLDGTGILATNQIASYINGTFTVTGGTYTLPNLALFAKSTLQLNGGSLSFGQTANALLNLSTGLNSSGDLINTGDQADANWTVQEPNGTTGAAETVYPNNADWFSSWAADGANSDWIAQNPNTNKQGAAPYTFTRTFNLTGDQLSNLYLVGDWNVDDTGTLSLNGHVIDTETNPYLNNELFPAFYVPGSSGFFNQGVNTLTITITESDQNFDGARLEAIIGSSGGLADVVNSTLKVGAGSTLTLPDSNSYMANGSTLSVSAGATLVSGPTVFNMPSTGQGATINAGIPLPRGLNLVIASGNFTGGTTVNVAAGTSLVISGGSFTGGLTFDVGPGGVVDLTGGQTVTYGGTLTGFGGGTVLLDSGTFYPAAGGATLDFTGNMFQWTGGAMELSVGNVTNSGTINLSGSNSTQIYADGTLFDYGSIIQTGSGSFNLHSDNVSPTTLTIEPGGQYLLESNAGIGNSGLGENVINNLGTIRKTSGTGTSQLVIPSQGSINNSGTIEADSGTLYLNATKIQQISGSSLTGGTWNASNGATLELPTGTAITTNAATIDLSGSGSTITGVSGLGSNSGTFTIASGAGFTTTGALSNSGTLTLGPASTLHVAGGFTQSAAGTVDEELGGTPASGLYGQAVITGAAALAGTFDVTLVNSFNPGAGQDYQVLSFGSQTGSFATFSGLPSGMSESTTATALSLLDTLTAPDLLPLSVTATPLSATDGPPVTVSWQVENQSTIAATGNWQDSVYLSTTPNITSNSILLGTVQHTGGLSGNGTYNASLTQSLPALPPGNYSAIVQVDSLYQTADQNRSNNTLAAASLLDVSVPALTLSSPFTGTFTAAGQEQYYQVTVPAGGSVQIGLSSAASSGAVALYVSQGSLPTPYSYQEAATVPNQPDQNLIVPQVSTSGTYYILAESISGNAATAGFTLTATQTAAITVAAPSQPYKGGNSGNLTIEIDGTNFTPGVTASLKLGGTTITDTTIDYVSASRFYATFNLTGATAGNYTLTVTASGQSVTSPATVQVVAATTEPLSVQLGTPSFIRSGRTGSIVVTYTNESANDIVAPLLSITSTNPAVAFSTPDDPNNFTQYAQVLAVAPGGPAGILRPGQSGTLTLTLLSEDTVDNDKIPITVSEIETGRTINWASQEASLRPTTISTAAWNVIFSNLVNTLGSTTDTYNAALAQAATYLSGLGETTNEVSNVSRLWSFLVAQADAEYPSTVLSSAVDASLPAPGSLPLAIDRTFVASIAGRYASSIFGLGWTTSWQKSVTVGTSGIVTINSGGSLTYFVLQPNGSYLATNGEYGSLSNSGGVFTFTDNSGTQYAFLPNGLLNYEQDTNGNRITIGYNGSEQLVSLTYSNPADGSEPSEQLTLSYNSQGFVSRVTDGTGNTWAYSYDSAGHLLSVAGPGGLTTTYTYDTGTNPETTNALLSVTNPDGSQQAFTYDPSSGRLTGSSQNGGANAISFTYGSEAEVTATDAVGDTTTVWFNDFGLASRVQSPLNGISTYLYDANGNLTSYTNAAGDTYQYSYDTKGDLTQTINPLGQTVEMTYGSLGNLTSITDADNNTTRYSYSATGNLLNIAYPDGTQQSFTYNPLGNLSDTIEQNGDPVNYQYNAEGLVTQESFADGSSAAFTYDAHGNLLTAKSYDPAGTLTGTTTLTYNAANELTTITYPNGQFLDFTYNNDGQRVESVDQDGYTIKYTYDSLGRLAELTDGSGNLIVQYSYNNVGELSKKVNGNGTYTTYAYDAAGDLTGEVNYAPGGTINSSFTYAYNVLGEQTSMTDSSGNTTSYAYDATGQLIQVTLPGGGTIAYVYNAAGDRSEVLTNGTPTSYSSNSDNEITQVGSTSYTYDANGNLTAVTDSSGTTTYTYNDLNQLTSITAADGTVTTFQYSPLGFLVGESVNGTQTNYLVDPTGSSSVVAAYNGSGSLITNYTYGLGLVDQSGPGGVGYYDFDGSGNTIGITGSSGAYVNQYSYLPFGETTTIASALPNPFTFAGQRGVMQVEANLFYMRARDYTPATGQFLSSDPTGVTGSGANLHEYAINDPLAYSDPTGLAPQTVQTPWGPWNLYLAGDPDLPANLQGYPLNGEAADTLGNNSVFDPNFAGSSGIVAHEFGHFLEGALGGDQSNETLPYFLGWFFGEFDYAAPDGNHYDISGDQWSYLTGQKVYHRPTPPQNPAPSPVATGTTINQISHDPNALVGPAGYGSQGFFQPGGALTYTVEFENDGSIAAQVVTVTEQLSSNLDWSTLQLGSFGFGSVDFAIPSGLTQYQTMVSYQNTDGSSLNVEVSLDFNPGTGQLTVSFESFDPLSGQAPTGETDGFLYPQSQSALGSDGFVQYTVQPKAGLTTGNAINQQASVVFDTNSPLSTGSTTNTVDVSVPTSSVTALPAVEGSTSFPVSWSGQDNPAGSGIAYYDVYVSVNNGPFTLWQNQTTNTSATYTGQVGNSYGFYSVATSNVGITQTAPTAAQTTTTINSASSSTGVSVTPNLIAFSSTSQQSVTLTATITSTLGAVSGGTVNFTVAGIGSITGIALIGDTATATLLVPANTPSGSHAVSAAYSGTGTFPASSGSGMLTIDAPPTLPLIGGTGSISAATNSLPDIIPLNAASSDGAALTYTVSVVGDNPLNDLQQQYQFQGLGYFTYGSSAYVLHSAQPGPGAGGYYLLRPSDGALFAYDGSGSYSHTFANSANLIATPGVNAYVDPTLLLDAQAPVNYNTLYDLQQQYQFQGLGYFSAGATAYVLKAAANNSYGNPYYLMRPSDGAVFAYDGSGSYAHTFANVSPVQINGAAAVLGANVYSNPGLLTNAGATPAVYAQLYQLNQQYDLQELNGSFYTNTYGHQAQWIYSPVANQFGQHWYTLTLQTVNNSQEAVLTAWEGYQDSEVGAVIADLDPSVYNNPAWLTSATAMPNPSAGTATVDSSGNLNLNLPNAGFIGSYKVIVTASDGFLSSTQAATVTVTDTAPSLSLQQGGNTVTPGTPLAIAHGSFPQTFTVTTVGAANATLTTTTSVSSYNPLFTLQQQYRFQGLGQFTAGAAAYVLQAGTNNAFGNPYYLLRPSDGALFAYDGSGSYAHTFANVTPLATLGAIVAADPGLLTNAQPSVDYTALYNLMQQYQFTTVGSGYYMAGASAYVLHSSQAGAGVGGYYLLATNGGLYAYDGSGSYAHTFANSANLIATLPAGVYSNPSLLLNAVAAPGLYTQLQAVEQAYDLSLVTFAIYGAPAYVLKSPLNNGNNNPYYLLSSTGALYAYDGSGSYAHTFANSSNLVATLDPSVFNNPSLLTNAKAPLADSVGGTAVTVTQPSGSPQTFTVNAPAGFVGTFEVTATTTDGSLSTTQNYIIQSTDTPPLPAQISSQTISLANPTATLTLSANDAQNDTVTYSAAVVGYSAEYALQQQYKFQGVGRVSTPDGVTAYVLQVSGLNGNGNPYYLLNASGGLYAYDGSGRFSTTFANSANLLAQLGPDDYSNPTLLTNPTAPTAPAATVHVTGNQLTVNVAGLSIGTIFEVLVSASDGSQTTTMSFLVTVSA
jgi:RHS repeat-associated protein